MAENRIDSGGFTNEEVLPPGGRCDATVMQHVRALRLKRSETKGGRKAQFEEFEGA